MSTITSMYKNWLWTGALAAVVFAGSVAAQEKAATGPGILNVTIVTIKPDVRPEFQKFIKDEFNAALIKGGEKQMWTWQTAAFGDPFKYVFVSSVSKFADMDSPGPMEKGLGNENMGAFFKKAGTFVTSVQSSAMIERPDLSYVTPNMAPPKMAVVVTIKAGPRQGEFDGYMLNEFLPAFKKSDAKALLVHQTGFGGDPHEYVLLVPIENFADLDKGHPIARAIGLDAWRAMRDKMPGTVTDVSVMRLNKNLSIIPEVPAK